MADIAMLVAEEYERRVKNSRKSDDQTKEIGYKTNWVSSSVSGFSQMIKRRIVGEETMGIVKKLVLEPRSQIGVAASDGVFSA